MLTELGIERRGVLAVLGVSRMREEVGDGHDDVAEVQNTSELQNRLPSCCTDSPHLPRNLLGQIL